MSRLQGEKGNIINGQFKYVNNFQLRLSGLGREI